MCVCVRVCACVRVCVHLNVCAQTHTFIHIGREPEGTMRHGASRLAAFCAHMAWVLTERNTHARARAHTHTHTHTHTQGAYTTLAMCGFIRQNGQADAALTRLWDEKQRGELRGQ